MNNPLQEKAEWLMEILKQLPHVQSCRLCGSLTNGQSDRRSDIDLEVDVCGMDDAAFVLSLPALLKEKIPVFYADYAPSLAPERYVVSIGLDENNPFLIADFCCWSTPHSAALTAADLKKRNDPYIHLLKLWITNLKHYARKANCRSDLVRMAAKAGIARPEECTSAELLDRVLKTLEINVPKHLQRLLVSCRKEYEQITKEEDA